MNVTCNTSVKLNATSVRAPMLNSKSQEPKSIFVNCRFRPRLPSRSFHQGHRTNSIRTNKGKTLEPYGKHRQDEI